MYLYILDFIHLHLKTKARLHLMEFIEWGFNEEQSG